MDSRDGLSLGALSWSQISVFNYSRLPKIDTPKIDTFSEISRNFEKIK